jgi:hypothetical protein
MYFGSGGSSASDVVPDIAALCCGDKRLSKKLLLLLLLLLLLVPPSPTTCRDVALYAAIAGPAAELGGGAIHAGGETAGAAVMPCTSGCCLGGTLPVWLKVGNGRL